MIEHGYEWQARELANAADAFAAECERSSAYELQAYAVGVADALRVAAGDVDPRAVETFRLIYERYLNNQEVGR